MTATKHTNKLICVTVRIVTVHLFLKAKLNVRAQCYSNWDVNKCMGTKNP